MLNSSEKTSFWVLPSIDFRVIAEDGVSGSIRPDLTFFSRGTLPTSMHIGSPAQVPPIGPVKRSIKVLHNVNVTEQQKSEEGKENRKHTEQDSR